MKIRTEQETRCYAWSTFIDLNQMVRVIYKKFHEVRWHIRLNQLKNRSASKIQQKILGAIAIKGGSEEPRERIIIRSKQILNFLVLAKRDLMVETAQDKLL